MQMPNFRAGGRRSPSSSAAAVAASRGADRAERQLQLDLAGGNGGDQGAPGTARRARREMERLRRRPAQHRRQYQRHQHGLRRHAAGRVPQRRPRPLSRPQGQGLGFPLDDIFGKVGATPNFADAVKKNITVDGEIVKAPVAVHLDGMLFYNKEVAAKAGRRSDHLEIDGRRLGRLRQGARPPASSRSPSAARSGRRATSSTP